MSEFKDVTMLRVAPITGKSSRRINARLLLALCAFNDKY